MTKKLSNRKVKSLFKLQKDDFAVYVDDKESDVFEKGSLVSSPLGGVMHRLRYYVVISAKVGKNFTNQQKDVINTKFRIVSESYDSKIEKITFFGCYALIKILVSVNKAVGKVVDKALEPLSKRGGFLRFHYLCVNTHKPISQEIRKYLKELG